MMNSKNGGNFRAGPYDSKTLVLDGEVGFEVMAADARNAVKGFSGNLNVSINSIGGEITEGLAIYNILKDSPAYVTMTVEGVAASIATIILMAADRRIMPENAWLMIHNPWSMYGGESSDFRRVADQLDGFAVQMNGIYSTRSGLTTEQVGAIMAEETWFNSDEALQMGLIDEISDALPMVAMLKSDVTGFRNVPARLEEQRAKAKATKSEAGNMRISQLLAKYGMSRKAGETDAQCLARIQAVAGIAARAEGETDEALMTRLEAAEQAEDAEQAEQAEDAEQAEQAAPAQASQRGQGFNAAAARAAATEAVAEERRRTASIHAMAATHGIPNDVTAGWIESGIATSTARARVLDYLASGNPTVGGYHASARADDTRDERMAAGVREAIMNRTTPLARGAQPSADAREFSGRSLLETARAYMVHTGNRDAATASRMDLAGMALHTTSDFPNILRDVIRTTLTETFNSAPRTFEGWTNRSDLTDFREVHRAALGDAPSLLKVNEHGEFKHGTMGDQGGKYRLETFGRIFGVTRQVLVNDDMNVFGRLPRAFANSAADLENEIVYDRLVSNPVMDDGNNLFSAAHGNVGTSAMPLTVESLSIARKFFRTGGIVNADGKKRVINMVPRTLIVPAALEGKARQLLWPSLQPTSTDEVQPWQDLELVVDPRLDAYSETAWYLVGDNGRVDTIEWGYLEGEGGLQLETRQGWEIDGTEIKARLDFGAGVIDWRGMYAGDVDGAWTGD